jgi:leader peptidase (prepilin peptidase)/N-methyltransferase
LEAYNIASIFVLGAIFGSFINVLIYRTPHNIDTVFKPSFCPHCKNKIKFYDNIPLLSYLILKGRCRSCSKKISPLYPIIEMSVAIIFLTIFIRSEISLNTLLVSILFSLFLALAVIDYRHKAIPDVVSLSALFVAFIIGVMFDTFLDIFIISGFLSIIRFYVSYFVKKEAM